jgi:hypothetical protein
VDRWILTGVCLTALGVAAWCAVRWGGLKRDEPREHEDGFGPNALATFRSATVTLYTAAIGGILVAGFGGRLFMRILAATSPDSLRGIKTQADEEIGRVTFGGSAFLIILGGLFAGLAVAGLYRVARRWLPATAWQAGAVTALITFGVFGAGQGLIAADNEDFRLLSPVWLAVLLIAATAVLFGATVGAVHDRLDRGMPTLSRSPKALLAYAPLLAFGLTIIVLPALLAVVLAGGVVAPLVTRAARGAVLVQWGRRVIAVAAAASAFVVASNAVDVLTLG